jgi:hypothetical protein
MSGFKEPSFADRQKAAQEARKNILNKFRSAPGIDDPAVAQRRADRDAEAAAEAAAQLAREKEEAAAREVALEAERKAARDARYAARKGKGKKK